MYLDVDRLLALVGKGAETVDLIEFDAGVSSCARDRIAAQLEFAAIRDAAVAGIVALANADDGAAVGKIGLKARHGQTMASGLIGLPVPPVMSSGAATNMNS